MFEKFLIFICGHKNSLNSTPYKINLWLGINYPFKVEIYVEISILKVEIRQDQSRIISRISSWQVKILLYKVQILLRKAEFPCQKN